MLEAGVLSFSLAIDRTFPSPGFLDASFEDDSDDLTPFFLNILNIFATQPRPMGLSVCILCYCMFNAVQRVFFLNR
jgi:hypothetical protein